MVTFQSSIYALSNATLPIPNRVSWFKFFLLASTRVVVDEWNMPKATAVFMQV